MILSDSSIRELCVCPSTYLDEAAYEEALRQPYSVPAVHPNDHFIKEHHKKLLEQCTRPLTEEMRAAFRPMIRGFVDACIREVSYGGTELDELVKRRVLSYGLSSYGYDVRLTEEFKIFTNANGGGIIDPKKLDEQACLVDGTIREDDDGSKYVILPPNSYLLARTEEYFDIPRDIMVVCVGKSTYARAGAIVNVTPIEPGFQGNVVIEIANSTTLPMRIYANEGISQFLFLRGDKPCETSYADRKGKYQGQTGIQLPLV